jgi:hypothetical protein
MTIKIGDIKKILDNYGEFVIILKSIDESLKNNQLILTEIKESFKNGFKKSICDEINVAENKINSSVKDCINTLYFKLAGTVFLIVTLILGLLKLFFNIEKLF